MPKRIRQSKGRRLTPSFLPSAILKKLPRSQIYKTKDLAKAFGVCEQAVRRAALKYDIGKNVRGGLAGRGTRIYVKEDITTLCSILQGVPGNQKAIRREE